MLNNVGLRFTTDFQKVASSQTQQSYVTNLLSKNQAPADKVDIARSKNVVSFTGHKFEFKQNAKEIQYISFGALQDPQKDQPIGIQMRVTGVKPNQSNTVEDPSNPKPAAKPQIKIDARGRKIVDKTGVTGPINRLAESFWKDGQPLVATPDVSPRAGDIMTLSDPKNGKLGRVPDEVYPQLAPLFENSEIKKDLKFELSNVIAGTTKGAATIGLRANLVYVGQDPAKKQLVQETFNKILNDPECKDKVMLYQPKASPDEVLKKIFSHEDAKKAGSSKEMDKAINNIVNVFDDPANKNFLFVGHCKPDGDTLGCILGMKNAMALKYPDKNIDCAVDDKIPGLFRHNIPGIDGEVKRPISKERIEFIDKEIEQIKKGAQNDKTKAEIEILQEEKQDVQNPTNQLKPKAKYDVVVMFDVPTPERFSGAFKQHIDEAKKVMYIDHHPHRLAEWEAAQPKTGIDMKKIHEKGLSLIADAVPAATQIVGILASKMMPDLNKIANGEKKTDEVFKTPEQQTKLKAFVASLVTGMSTDTGSYLRTANLLPEDMLKPAQQRPNFMPEGMTKWLMGLTDGTKGNIDKKWLRENISYDLDDKKNPDLPVSARETMLDYSVKGKVIAEDPKLGKLGLGIVQVDYDQMFDVWNIARKSEKANKGKAETTFLDVQNGFKYGEVMNILRSDPSKHPGNEPNPAASEIENAALEDYESPYDDKRIAILICQDKKAGCLDEKLNIAEQNGLRLSLRSQEGTVHAELLANLFSGGGHGGASGGRVDLPGVTLKTPLGVEIDGKREADAAAVLKQLAKNHEIMNDLTKTDEQKAKECKKVKVVLDNQGKPCADLIKDIVVAMRNEDGVGKLKNKVVSFNRKPSTKPQQSDNVLSFDNPFGNHKPDRHGRKRKNSL